MAIQTINLGTYANDGTGDDLRTAFQKVNANFAELNTLTITGGTNLGTGTAVFAGSVASPATGDNLSFKTLVSGPNITITSNSNEITIAGSDSIYNIVEDLTPQLGGDLDLNGFNIVGADSPANITILNSTLSIDAYNIDSGDFNPIGINGIQISGTNLNTAGTVRIGTFDNSDDNLNIIADQELHLSSVNDQIYFDSTVNFTTGIYASSFNGPTLGTHTGPVIGNVTGDTTGTHIGAVVGTVSSLSNHRLSSLSDVSVAQPTPGQGLIWSGTVWEPRTISATIGDSLELDLGTALAPNPSNLDFGSVSSPSDLLYDFGSIGDNSVKSFGIITVDGQENILASNSVGTINFAAENGILITTNSATNTVSIRNTFTETASFSAIEVTGQSNIQASASSTLKLVAGSGVSLTTDVNNNAVTITNIVSPGTGLASRITLSISTAVIADGATDNVTIVNGYKGYVLYKIETSDSAWVRIYTDNASRTADAARSELDDPAPNAGVITEIITTGAETILLAPSVFGFNNESTPDNTIPMAITNKSGGTTSITVSLTVIQLEV